MLAIRFRGRKHVRTLMRRMGIEPLYRKPNTSKRHPGHKIYPYLLRNVAITAPNQAWAMDITYVPMARGFVYLAAVMDWYSRKVLAWRLSNSLDSSFCVDAVEEAIAKFGTPAIFNTDQGSQGEFQRSLQHLQIGGVKWDDNVFVERLWRTVKYEEVYLRAYDSVSQARDSLSRYFDIYNAKRTHSSLARRT